LKIYWQERKSGQRLILDSGDGEEMTLGGVRKTSGGFDAFATTFGYEPGRAVKGLPTLEEGKDFVISFEPWNLFDGGQEALPVEPEVRPLEGP
jgi:hypothetical protein